MPEFYVTQERAMAPRISLTNLLNFVNSFFYKKPNVRTCQYCKVGKVTLCDCGCVYDGYGQYVCDNQKCNGDELEILGSDANGRKLF